MKIIFFSFALITTLIFNSILLGGQPLYDPVKPYQFPLQGDWVIFPNGKKTGVRLFKVQTIEENYSTFFDLTHKFLKSQKLKNPSFHGYLAQVVALESGWVLEVNNHLEENNLDHPNETPGFESGNFVFIEQIDGRKTLYGSLSFDSIPFKKGDFIGRGENLGKVGNSGKSLLPGLLLEVQDLEGNSIDPVFQNLARRYSGYPGQNEAEEDFLEDIFLPPTTLKAGWVVAEQSPRLDPVYEYQKGGDNRGITTKKKPSKEGLFGVKIDDP